MKANNNQSHDFGNVVGQWACDQLADDEKSREAAGLDEYSVAPSPASLRVLEQRRKSKTCPGFIVNARDEERRGLTYKEFVINDAITVSSNMILRRLRKSWRHSANLLTLADFHSAWRKEAPFTAEHKHRKTNGRH